MKKISVLIPCYNEEENIEELVNEIKHHFLEKLPNYNYEIIFIDNASTDKTREIIEKISSKDKKIKAIFNIRNFGGLNSPYYGLLQTTGDCTIQIACDFQEPIEMIEKFVHEWENGYKIVVGVKNKSKENIIMKLIRKMYYRLLKKFSAVEQISQFTGCGLYDKDFISILRKLNDPTPFFRGIVAEYGYKRKELYYEQSKRKHGKSKYNFYNLFDYAMLSFTSYTKFGLRIATFIGIIISIISFIIGTVYLILKLLFWNSFSMGLAPMLIGTFFLGALQIFFIGFLGEYIMSINERVKNRPLVIEEKRINFE